MASANHRNGDNGEGGILTAAEAALLDLRGTQLVGLSAGETGTGGVTNGEGVYGLRRALVLAGAQSKLVSRWKVNDAATEQMMGEYYREAEHRRYARRRRCCAATRPRRIHTSGRRSSPWATGDR